jgi:histone acetyltransferase (RNA polymerase elongator complex component)
MSSTTITTVVKMMESLPETAQERVADQLREFIADLSDDLRWERSYAKTQPQLVAAAHRARQEMAAGKAKPLNLEEL